MKFKMMLGACVSAALLAGCASGPSSKPGLPADARPVTGEELKTLFTDVSEAYTAIDYPGVTSKATWRSNGEFEADWSSSDDKGHIEGNWYVDGEKRCIKFTLIPDGWDELECTTVYQTGDKYTTLNADGTLHGTHILLPL